MKLRNGAKCMSFSAKRYYKSYLQFTYMIGCNNRDYGYYY